MWTKTLQGVIFFGGVGLGGVVVSHSGCGKDAGQVLSMLPPLAHAPLTTQVRRVPLHGKGPDLGNPALPENLPTYLKEGYGEFLIMPGEPHTARTLDGSPTPRMGAGAKRILRFGTMGDFQVMDDESPLRVGFLDAKGATQAALRPQDPYMCQLANAAVRTMNAVHRMDPLSMVFVGGDILDSAHGNELDWALAILRGGQPVECDSGDDDDLVPGPNNDPKDSFLPEGLAVPWYWVPGNHDFLIQGNVVVDDAKVDAALGDFAPLGTRDYRRGGSLAQKAIIPDPRRRPMNPRELIERMARDGNGHGVSVEQASIHSGTYFFDMPDSPVRFLIMDTASKTGSAQAVVRKSDFERTIRPAFDGALAQRKWVVILSDSPIGNFKQADKPFGTEVPDPMTEADWLRETDRYPNLLFMLGRGSYQLAHAIKTPSGRLYWELLNAAMSDHPQQLRIFELWDGDNGFLMLRATCVDLATEDDPLAQEAERRAVIDFTSTWMAGSRNVDGNRNVDLWIRKP
jgi:hypothetical protein